MFHEANDYTLLDAELELSSADLELVLGGTDSSKPPHLTSDPEPSGTTTAPPAPPAAPPPTAAASGQTVMDHVNHVAGWTSAGAGAGALAGSPGGPAGMASGAGAGAAAGFVAGLAYEAQEHWDTISQGASDAAQAVADGFNYVVQHVGEVHATPYPTNPYTF